MHNDLQEFLHAIQQALGPVDFAPVGDGHIHRFHVSGDRSGTTNGWYALHAGKIAYGTFGSWKTGATFNWSSRKPKNFSEATQIARDLDLARQQREAEKLQLQSAAGKLATLLWENSEHANPSHPYLRRKGVGASYLREIGNVLLVPLYYDGELVNLQRIHSDGTKRFLRGGRVGGCHALLGLPEPGQTLYLCEGFATGASIHEATGHAVACAMNANNLLAAGDQLRRLYPDSPIVIAGDDDRKTEAKGRGNPGRTAAFRAASALGCAVTLPQFPPGAPLELSDFNDLANWRTAQ